MGKEGPYEVLPAKIMDQYVTACLHGLLEPENWGVPQLGRVHDQISKAIVAQEAILTTKGTSEWKKLFASLSNDTWKAASAVVHGGARVPIIYCK